MTLSLTPIDRNILDSTEVGVKFDENTLVFVRCNLMFYFSLAN